MDEGFGTPFTDEMLRNAECVSLKEVQEDIRKADKEMMLERCAKKALLIADIGKEVGCSRSSGIV